MARSGVDPVAEYAEAVRPVTVSLKAGRYPRAVSGDGRYGLTCPLCGGGKTRQALRCSVCYHAGRAAPSELLALRLRRWGTGVTHSAIVPRRLIWPALILGRRALAVDALITARCGAGLTGLKVVMSTDVSCRTCQRLEAA